MRRRLCSVSAAAMYWGNRGGVFALVVPRVNLSFRGHRNQIRRATVAPPEETELGLAPRYDFKSVEESLYSWWEEEGYFTPRGDGKPYTIPMPPPNVTGRLHLGHAMFVALQDILARFHRMRGRKTLWLPGTDHAGIATQLSVEKAVESEGESRIGMGRDAFLKRVWAWKEENGGMITQQMRRLGASADWSRERFTLEPAMSSAVKEAFVRLHEQGLVYRGERMVNWSPNLRTAVSDLEVETVDRIGKLYYFNYPIIEDGEASGQVLPVATTRPETILGDTAVCVSPEDERYKHLIGKNCMVPTVGRIIPIIADDYVDPEFGTGALKITPGHDPNDYALGKKYDLPIVSIMESDGSISEGYGKFSGLDRFECRKELWSELEALGLAVKTEEKPQRLPISQRGGEVVEPMVSTQWFVKTEGMAAKAADAVRQKDIRIVPPRFEKEWFNWLDNIEHWCVSRQLWWGHRIPAWYGPDGNAFVARDEAEAKVKAAEFYGTDAKDINLKQDDDVLDTWFSSGLWPFATVGWPDKEQPDFRRFYPANCLETGYDILFFWVARMVMLGMELTGEIPFDTIYMHGLVRDEKGKKMSKTTGNVIDPLEVVNTYGADALRYTLVTGVTPGQDVPLSMDRVEQNRNFANKLWNVGRFVNFRIDQAAEAGIQIKKHALSHETMTSEEIAGMPLPERWIISKAHAMAEAVAASLEDYAVGDAGRRVYEFLWDELADWYVEVAKTREFGSERGDMSFRALIYAYDIALKTIHPFMPHVTEFLWQRTSRRHGIADTDALMISAFPALESSVLPVDDDSLSDFDAWRELVRGLRNLRAEYDVETKSKMALTIVVSSSSLADAIKEEAQGLALLAKVDVERLQILVQDTGSEDAPEDSARVIVADGRLEAFVPYSDLKTVKDFAKELDRLERQLTKLEKDISSLDGRLSKPGFIDKAPANVVEEAKNSLAEKQEQRDTILASVASLKEEQATSS